MGIADTVAPASDQLDAIDLREPMTFTITKVDYKPTAEQPIVVHLAEFDRPWKPGKNMRRVLLHVWGDDEQAYIGRRLTLFNNPKVKWAGKEVGGSRISHMSHIDKRVEVPVLVSQGQTAKYTVQPLKEDAPAPTPEPTAAQVSACTDLDQLGAMWRASGPERRTQIEERVAEIKAADQNEKDWQDVDAAKSEWEAEK